MALSSFKRRKKSNIGVDRRPAIKMSQHSDENLLVAGSDSFWEPANYKRTTKRIEDGHRLCNDLMALVQDRADIEKAYAKNLKAWSRKWNETIEKGPEYGTTEAGWKGVCLEADRLGDLHLKIKDNLCNDVTTQIKTWQKESYHKSMMQIKEKKEMDDAFRKAQKPWEKLLSKVNKAKADYHAACKAEKSAANQERNAAGDTSISQDQTKKLRDRVEKAKEDVLRFREKYESALAELKAYNAKYVEEMTGVFDKCQDIEAQRLKFFKEVLFAIQQGLNISENSTLPQIYQEFNHTINNADYEKDLRWWSNNHGANMAMNWPEFEEYTEEFRDISKGRGKEAIPAGQIVLINQRPVGEGIHEYPPVNNKAPKKVLVSAKSDVSRDVTDKSNKTNSNKSNTNSSPTKTSPITNGTRPPETTPFDDDEWEEEDGNEALVDNGEPGVPVKALYDYDGAESDELSFKQGDVFDKLEDEDEQGWCKGRKDGKVGLYPANYVEAFSP